MAATFKYLKKMIVTITKGPRKGQKELRYFYKGDKIPGAAAAKASSAIAPVGTNLKKLMTKRGITQGTKGIVDARLAKFTKAYKKALQARPLGQKEVAKAQAWQKELQREVKKLTVESAELGRSIKALDRGIKKALPKQVGRRVGRRTL